MTTKQKLDYEIVRLEDYTRGTLFVADSAVARPNKAVFERHLSAEWASDIETTMATIHRDRPYQRIPALGVDIDSFEGIREFYLGRFKTWPGPALRYFNRCTLTDECIYVEGMFQIQGSGDLAGLNIAGPSISTPCIIVLDCRDGLLVGEIVYMDGSALKN
jgi:hypothetical protein